MTIFLHIGMQKTGTTFLQVALHKKAGELAKYGVIYPDTLAGIGKSTSPAHHFLAHAISGRRLRYTPHADFSQLPRHVNALKQEINASSGVSVISTEDFSGFNENKIRNLRNHFPEDNVKILVYLRRQDAWLDSLYGQMLKVGCNASIEEVIKAQQWRLDYSNLLGLWEEQFGRENIVVRVYENLKGIGLWSDFLTAIGKPEATSVDPEVTSANDSLSYELSMFMKSLNIYGQLPGIRRMAESLNEYFPNQDGLKFLSQTQATELMLRYKDINALVAKKYLGRDILFSNSCSLPSPEQQELSNTGIVQVFGGITIRMLERMKKMEKRISDLESTLQGKPKTKAGAGQ